MLELNRINTFYGKIQALRDVSLKVEDGEIVTLIGANGAGKSTTLMSICGVIHPRSGEILFDGKPIQQLPAPEIVKRGISQVPEGRLIFPELTVRENLDLGAFLRTDKKGIADDMEYVFQLFPILRERVSQTGGTLSGGEQQMLAMGRALMSHPKLLMLGEPSMGLAPILVEQIFGIIRELHASGTTILLVEQNAQAALEVADRAYVLETGRIVLSGTGAELMASDQVQKAYLGG